MMKSGNQIRMSAIMMAAAFLLAGCEKENENTVDNNTPVPARITAAYLPPVIPGLTRNLPPRSTKQEIPEQVRDDRKDADGAAATPANKAGKAAQPATRAVGDRWNRDHIGVVVYESPASDMAARYRNAHYVTTSTGTSAEFAPADAANTIYFADADITGDATFNGQFSSTKSYEYTVRLRKSGIEVTGATITDWTDGGTGSGDAVQQ